MTQRAVYKNDVLDAAPVMLKGYFSVDKTADTFLYLLFFNRGVAFVNGFVSADTVRRDHNLPCMFLPIFLKMEKIR